MDCQVFYIGKTKRRLHDGKTEHFKEITSSCHASAIADVTSTGILKWNHFDILAKGQSDTHCKIKEILLIREVKPTLNDNVSRRKALSLLDVNFSQLLSLLLLEGRTGGSLARFTDRKIRGSRITDIKISFSRITKIRK